MKASSFKAVYLFVLNELKIIKRSGVEIRMSEDEHAVTRVTPDGFKYGSFSFMLLEINTSKNYDVCLASLPEKDAQKFKEVIDWVISKNYSLIFAILHEIGHIVTMDYTIYSIFKEDFERRLANNIQLTKQEYRLLPWENAADIWALNRLKKLHDECFEIDL